MKRILITGASGFVARHFIEYLGQVDEPAEVLGISRGISQVPEPAHPRVRVTYRAVDLLDRATVGATLRSFAPTHILHLAAYSSVGFSWQNPVESFNNNTNVLLNLLEEVRLAGSPCRILSIGSSEEYGDVQPSELPLREESPLRPLNPYAVARVAQELLSRVYVRGYKLEVVLTRSFNHIGAHQRDAFVVPSLAKQLVAIKYRGAAPRIVTGDRSVVRDFVDVRDVVRAYYRLLEVGLPGEIYNVCSGRGVSIDELLGSMQEILGVRVDLETDPKLVRPSDNRIIIGSADKLHRVTGWQPSFELRESLRDILDWWKGQLS